MALGMPSWLEALNSQKFFAGCSFHEGSKNEKNGCCLDCCTSICPHCVPSRRKHRLIQVRCYVYHDVVRLQVLEKQIDCSNVQSYTINSSKVVFIKKGPKNSSSHTFPQETSAPLVTGPSKNPISIAPLAARSPRSMSPEVRRESRPPRSEEGEAATE